MQKVMERVMRHTLIITAAALLLGGCALSPQQVQIQPDPQVQSNNLGHNQPVKVIAVDSRGEEAFGSRGGVYASTSTISPSNDVRQAIVDSVRKGLQQLGFNAYNPGDDATALEVRLEKLQYIPEKSSVVNEVTLNLVMTAEAKRHGVTHTGSYKTSVDHKSPFTPTQAQNQKMINDILSQAIQRMLEDPKMIAFLAGSDNP